MKIFSRSAEKEKPASAPKAPSAAPHAASAPSGPAAASAAPPAGAASAAPASAPQPAGPPAPDISAIIDANVKEMSEKIARLATTIEGDKGDRADFEAKLEKMEERMRKLSALTEMISAQYNPFVGAAPSEREAPPQPEFGLSQPPSALPLPPNAPLPPANAAAAPALTLEDPLASVASALVPPPPPAPPEPAEVPMEPPAPPAEATALALATPDEMAASFAGPTAQYDDSDDENGSIPITTSSDPSAGVGGPRLWSVRPTFGSSMLMLSWADMLLKNAPDRQALLQLLDYYQNISWIGAPAREQLLAYADGIRSSANADAADETGDWRAPLEVHERSLLFVEKLRAISEGRSKGD